MDLYSSERPLWRFSSDSSSPVPHWQRHLGRNLLLESWQNYFNKEKTWNRATNPFFVNQSVLRTICAITLPIHQHIFKTFFKHVIRKNMFLIVFARFCKRNPTDFCSQVIPSKQLFLITSNSCTNGFLKVNKGHLWDLSNNSIYTGVVGTNRLIIDHMEDLTSLQFNISYICQTNKVSIFIHVHDLYQHLLNKDIPCQLSWFYRCKSAPMFESSSGSVICHLVMTKSLS